MNRQLLFTAAISQLFISVSNPFGKRMSPVSLQTLGKGSESDFDKGVSGVQNMHANGIGMHGEEGVWEVFLA